MEELSKRNFFPSMCICSVHGYRGEFTFPATVGRIVGHVAEGVMHTIHFYISVLIAPKPGLCIKKYSVRVFRSGEEVSLLYSRSRSELFAS